jgi:hypothetical protein
MGDHRPTDQDYVVFHQLSASLDRITGQVDQVVSTELKELNEQLGRDNLQPVVSTMH